ncbi:hypothetical protein HID58_029063 [Brassica napus]|uniref:Uncharacterized protein n=1 Tax=Brassica napus TaxID=3708 RepID=A0ABQ8CCY9_BRANA|nr:hypothetical protein HID58_029063 [Brassica napus]
MVDSGERHKLKERAKNESARSHLELLHFSTFFGHVLVKTRGGYALISPNHRTGLGYTSRILGGGNRLAVRLCLLTGTRLFERRDEAAGVEIGLCLNKREMDLFVSLFQNGL